MGNTNLPNGSIIWKALCSVIYKIISKVIANPLKPLLPKLIFPKQSGFVEGRKILDGVILVHEVIHSLKSTRQPGMLIKLDIGVSDIYFWMMTLDHKL